MSEYIVLKLSNTNSFIQPGGHMEVRKGKQCEEKRRKWTLMDLISGSMDAVSSCTFTPADTFLLVRSHKAFCSSAVPTVTAMHLSAERL